MTINQLTPELLVEDIPETISFYKEKLGFHTEIKFPEKDPTFVQVGRDDIHRMLYNRSGFEKEIPRLKKTKMGGSVLLYIKANKINGFYKKIKNRVSIIQPIHKTNYGSLEFTMEDNNGYLIAFSEEI